MSVVAYESDLALWSYVHDALAAAVMCIPGLLLHGDCKQLKSHHKPSLLLQIKLTMQLLSTYD